MEKYDVIVIGAGPSGACTAYLLAKSGVHVLVIDKERFPRFKPCAGGLTVKALKAFDFPIKEEIKFCTNSIVLSHKNQVFYQISGNKRLAGMVERQEFDHFLIKKAVDAGAEFLEGEKVKGIVRGNGGFSVETEEEVFKSDYLVGADGANSVVNRTFNIVNKDLYGFGVETNCPVSKSRIENYSMTFDFGGVPDGYLWIFPKAQHLCIGAYTIKNKMKHINLYLSNYIESLGLSPESNRFKGHIIPFYGIAYKQPEYPCILVGDAAGFGDYWTGEGIYYAVKSGIITAETILSSIKAASFQYELLQKRYDTEIIRGLKLAYQIGKIFYAHLPRSLDLLMLSLPSSLLYEGFAKGFTYDQIISKSHILFWNIIRNESTISNQKYHK